MIVLTQTFEELISGWSEHLPDFLPSLELKNCCFDSREVTVGSVLFVLPSVAGKEQSYIDMAISNGVSLIVSQDEKLNSQAVPHWVVDDVLALAGFCLAKLRPANNLNVFGVTGTNGKSSVTFYVAQLLEMLGEPAAVMGTVGYGHWQRLKPTGMTTLPLEMLHESLHELSKTFKHVAMEVSSHGLDQNRLAGVSFKGAMFTNLTRDHLDYHKTMEAYGAAKARLLQWPELELAIVNVDDEFGVQLMDTARAQRIISYGQSNEAEIRFDISGMNADGMELGVFYGERQASFSLPLYGEFNAANVVGAMAYCIGLGFEFQSVCTAAQRLQSVPGRMEVVKVVENQPVVLVDYAHTPDALEQACKAVRQHQQGEITVVVGCGGDRDQGKRPIMGKIAAQYADKVVFTSDNPRSESPAVILEHIMAGVEQERVGICSVIEDRAVAIEQAIVQSTPQDVVLIAGKGHEDYQEVNGHKHYFSDVDSAKAVIGRELLS